MQKLISKIRLFVIVALLAGMNACKQTDLKSGDSLVNEFIAVNMDYWYYWRDKIPAGALDNKTLAPETFFNSLLYTFDKTARPDGDRFSRFLENAGETEASLSGESKTTGARLALYNSNGTIAGFVMYVFPGSPAAKAGIKRGDIFAKITVDGQLATTENYAQLFTTGTNYVFTAGRYENKAFVAATQTKAVVAQALQEDPMLLDTVYTKGTKKIGYLVYNRFYSKPNNSDQPLYDQKMAAIFGKYKAAGINEFILDLRYNGGGYTSTARTLASFIGKGVTDKTIFSKDEYNAKATPELVKNQGKDFNVNYFQPKSENIGGNLQRVYVLVSSRTASASELVINGLKPFLDVFLIGDVTVGKNVGSILIKDPKNRFPQGMMPIVIKVFNSAGQSEYTAGFTPNVTVKEDISQPFYAFGDLREPLLSEAYFQITGSRNARRGISGPLDSDRLRIAPSWIETEMISDKPLLK
ncbi:S41 family peptidase [Runella slithyformis]|uniref:Peptidase S41 n=1 Tax=Runella slithyformis (strain ATCC 29530 / DSM 19594 / LMG 11500 / NCIMB 11436 / LSU 4) TaxID=761193 RepID=A0A7U3ZLZ1_RUNSL|nr:S41 family peptidase [Runella slithyformis]AEI49627.1 peptidase S41 [Runella slithyformis DSM 19594]